MSPFNGLRMRAAVCGTTSGGSFAMRCVPVPQPAQGEILVKLEACGVCHTDLHVWNGSVLPGSGKAATQILGHEGVGRVVATGAGAEGFVTGDRVGVPWLHDTCGICDECLAGQESFCQLQRAHGFDVDGGFAEYVIVDARYGVPLPDGPAAASLAPLMCAGVTAYSAVRRAKLKPGMRCAIFGCGGLGLYAIQIAVRSGAFVIALDISEEKLRLAESMGAQATLIADDLAIGKLKGLGGMHACINFAPTAATWPLMIETIRPRGRIVATAMVSTPVPINQEWLTGTGVVITGTSVGTRFEMRELLRMHADLPFTMETHEIPLDGIENALHALAEGGVEGRFVIRYD
ncbi:MAG: alcohol dehydrogenase catalytic domain-containing protein [Phyllobacterium sp.]|uniref:alcohol dehydrogenase catalytic domain-containing protein n=1 Tax=Phyllobacterium sp. TaxID=1871046 RepID=UPI0030F27F11